MRSKIIAILLLVVVNSTYAQKGIQDIRNIVNVHVTEPKRVAEIFDSLRKVEFAEKYLLDMVQSEMYSEMALYRLCIEYGNQALEADSVQLNPQYNIHQSKILVTAYTNINDYPKALTLLYKILDNKNNISPKDSSRIVADMLFTIGTIKHKLGEKTEAYDYFEQSKQMLKESKNAGELALYSYFLGEITTTLIDDADIEGAFEICRQREDVIRQIDSLGGAPKGYTDQQRAYLYSKCAHVCMLKKESKRAKEFYEKFLATNASKRVFEGSFIASYLIEDRQYSKALDYLIPVMRAYQEQDTINLEYRGVLSKIEKCHYGLRDYATALRYKKIELDITDSLSVREKSAQAIEINTIYETEQRKTFIATQAAQIKQQRLWVIIFGLMLLFVLSTVAIVGFNIIQKRRRNEKRYRQIMEGEALRVQGERDANSQELFNRLEEVMINDKLYANTDLDRDILCHILGTNATYLAAAVKQNCGLTILGYINSVRLNYAKKMLIQADKFDIEQVAIDSGFGSSRTLYRQFKSVLELTPLEFYKLSHKSKS